LGPRASLSNSLSNSGSVLIIVVSGILLNFLSLIKAGYIAKTNVVEAQFLLSSLKQMSTKTIKARPNRGKKHEKCMVIKNLKNGAV